MLRINFFHVKNELIVFTLKMKLRISSEFLECVSMPETSREECPFDQLLKRKKKSKMIFLSQNFNRKRAQVVDWVRIPSL